MFSNVFKSGNKVFQKLNEVNKHVLLRSSLHPIRLIDALNSSLANPNYFDYEDENLLNSIKQLFPAFSRIKSDLYELSNSVRELKLDNQEMAIYKTYLAFTSCKWWRKFNFSLLISYFHSNLKLNGSHPSGDLKGVVLCDSKDRPAWKYQKQVQFQLSQALRQFMFMRRNESESSKVLFQMMACIQQMSFNLQQALKDDMHHLAINGYTNFFNEFSKYFFIHSNN